MKTLEQWLTYINELHPAEIHLGLERVGEVASRLNLTHFDCPVVTIAGTNGKGSCVKLLESILLASGYRVGAYTSPHLLQFNERIRIDNLSIGNKSLCAAFEVIEQARQGTVLTYFEFTTLAALWIFKAEQLDVLLLEIGLGGRLDAVNIVNADLAIITSIELDHTDWLGNTREAIGFEKAGIFRSHQTAICGDPMTPDSVFQQAKLLDVDLLCVGSEFNYWPDTMGWTWSSKVSTLENLPLPILSIQNAATVLMAVEKLQSKLPIPLTAIKQGIQSANLWGRFQQISDPPCILDVAHNPAAGKLLAQTIEKRLINQPIIAVVGMLADKDIANTLSPLLPYIKAWHFGTLQVPRGATAQCLASHLQDFRDAKCYTYESISEAFLSAIKDIKPSEKILVFGSFYTVAEILKLLQNMPNHTLKNQGSNVLTFDEL